MPPWWYGKISAAEDDRPFDLTEGASAGRLFAYGLHRLAGLAGEAVVAGSLTNASAIDEQLAVVLVVARIVPEPGDLFVAFHAVVGAAVALILDRLPAFDAARGRLERQRRLDRAAVARLGLGRPDPRLADLDRLGLAAALDRLAGIVGLGTPREARVRAVVGAALAPGREPQRGSTPRETVSIRDHRPRPAPSRSRCCAGRRSTRPRHAPGSPRNAPGARFRLGLLGSGPSGNRALRARKPPRRASAPRLSRACPEPWPPRARRRTIVPEPAKR